MAQSDYPTARQFLPDERDLESLAEASQGCQGCPLFKDATQTVFGSGATDADIMLVGEQPGRKEDEEGKPFVGPSGKVLDQAFEEAGVHRDAVYITNAVKHFKSEGSDGGRQGLKPNISEINACRPWLESEIEAVEPEIIIALGAVAARSLAGRPLTVGEAIGSWLETEEGRDLIVTYHPSAALRAPAETDRDRIFDVLAGDLSRAWEAVAPMRPGPRAGA